MLKDQRLPATVRPLNNQRFSRHCSCYWLALMELHQLAGAWGYWRQSTVCADAKARVSSTVIRRNRYGNLVCGSAGTKSLHPRQNRSQSNERLL
jgi:hypothetical protein